jgi:hypothetical protein
MSATGFQVRVEDDRGRTERLPVTAAVAGSRARPPVRIGRKLIEQHLAQISSDMSCHGGWVDSPSAFCILPRLR